jgi:hypothetical protein
MLVDEGPLGGDEEDPHFGLLSLLGGEFFELLGVVEDLVDLDGMYLPSSYLAALTSSSSLITGMEM